MQKTENITEQEDSAKRVHSYNNINYVPNSIPYEPFNYNEGDFNDKKDTYLTHVKGKLL